MATAPALWLLTPPIAVVELVTFIPPLLFVRLKQHQLTPSATTKIIPTTTPITIASSPALSPFPPSDVNVLGTLGYGVERVSVVGGNVDPSLSSLSATPVGVTVATPSCLSFSSTIETFVGASVDVIVGAGDNNLFIYVLCMYAGRLRG